MEVNTIHSINFRFSSIDMLIKITPNGSQYEHCAIWRQAPPGAS